jgi:predicted MPP superfamily phosphohydrolase
MMNRIYALIFIAVGSLIISGTIVLLLRFLHPDWWKRKSVRFPALISMAGIPISLLIWLLGSTSGIKTISDIGMTLASIILLIQLSLILSLPLSGVIPLFFRIKVWLARRFGRSESEIQKSRREFIMRAAAIIPGAALTTQAAAIAGAYAEIKVPVINLPIAGLPEKLRGLKIAHLSDSHLGHYKYLDDLEEAVEKITPHSPDLVLVTGDISDDLSILGDAIRIIDSIDPPLGVFASVGNHEYYRGIAAVRKIFEKSPFPMLIDEGVLVEKEGHKIFIGGADDPVSLRSVNIDFLKQTVKKTLEPAPDDSFRILMSHRPRGLDFAPDHGVSLVLAGHTHGGQVGFFGRSAFEAVWPELYLWGIYRKKNTTLYTSSGMGHWMPLRIACPAEAPILILEKSVETNPV